jgi:membrane fusion protein, multidrug efflux system
MKKAYSYFAIVTLFVLLSVSKVPSSSPRVAREVNEPQPNAPGAGAFWVAARTQCVPGRKCIIAPVPLHPVVEVKVAAGDKVKKDQVLVKLDDDEPQADVRQKKALLESAKVVLQEADRYLAKAQEMYKGGALPEAKFFAAQTAAHKAAHDERAAVAAVEGAVAELEHYEVQAMIDGVVSWLDVHLGTVSRPGTTVWGEILDLNEIDVKCDVTPEQADRVAIGQYVEVRQTKKNGAAMTGKVVTVGIAVSAQTGLVPVLVRVPNPQGVLRCGEAVQAGFSENGKAK